MLYLTFFVALSSLPSNGHALYISLIVLRLFKAVVKVLRKEDFPEPVTPTIMILMNGTFGVKRRGNEVNFCFNSLTVYKIKIMNHYQDKVVGMI